MADNPLTQSITNGLACQKIESWGESNWDLMAKDTPYLDISGEKVAGKYDLIVIDVDDYLIELDIVSGMDSDYERINRAMRENDELGYIPSHINSWEISPKFRYAGDIGGNIYYTIDDEPKLSDPESQELFDSIFGFNPVNMLEKADAKKCSNL